MMVTIMEGWRRFGHQVPTKEEKKVPEQEVWMILLMEGRQEDSNWKIEEVEEIKKENYTHQYQ